MINFWTSPCVAQERKERRERERLVIQRSSIQGTLGGIALRVRAKKSALTERDRKK